MERGGDGKVLDGGAYYPEEGGCYQHVHGEVGWEERRVKLRGS